jgi:hypothetical protein
MDQSATWICQKLFAPEFKGKTPCFWIHSKISPVLSSFCKKAVKDSELYKTPALPRDESLKYSGEAMIVIKTELLAEIMEAEGEKITELKGKRVSGELYLDLEGCVTDNDMEKEEMMTQQHMMEMMAMYM